VLSITGVTAIMLTANLLLLILYENASSKQQSRQRYAARRLRLVFPIRCRFGPNIVLGVEREWALRSITSEPGAK
jgi:hypothetical protein